MEVAEWWRRYSRATIGRRSASLTALVSLWSVVISTVQRGDGANPNLAVGSRGLSTQQGRTYRRQWGFHGRAAEWQITTLCFSISHSSCQTSPRPVPAPVQGMKMGSWWRIEHQHTGWERGAVLGTSELEPSLDEPYLLGLHHVVMPQSGVGC